MAGRPGGQGRRSLPGRKTGIGMRLVAMVRWLGDQLETLQQSPRVNCYFGSTLEKAYTVTEERHD